ncbi:cytochrome P450 [Artemisia annua]|uniref:Cytochrome P450 n=1 Tax=Artemisia annua TaxID=35608 RepID=A0A2U1M4T3_ARTAN|nr:cytochrome P450 [Artemisia annua]
METIISVQTFLLSSILSLTIFICIKWNLFHSHAKKNLPPSPPKMPLIGNMLQLGSSPHRSLHALSQKYGPLMLLHLGSKPTLVASSSEVAREILKTHDLSFSGRPNLQIPNILMYGSKDIVFSPYGEYWRQLKSIVVVHLLSNTRVKSFQNVREKEIGLMIDAIGESCGSLLEIRVLLKTFTNNIISRAAIGRTHDGLKLTNMLEKHVNLVTAFNIGSYIPWLSWIDQVSGLKGRAREIAKEVDMFLEDVVKKHVNTNRGVNGESDEPQDLLDILLDVQQNNTDDFVFQKNSIKAVILITSNTIF